MRHLLLTSMVSYVGLRLGTQQSEYLFPISRWFLDFVLMVVWLENLNLWQSE